MGRRAVQACALIVFWSISPVSLSATPPAWAIASAEPLATEAGFEIARAGGNAFDAAVAVSAALAVVEPMGSGVGGGGFWLLHRASDGLQTMVDGRERAPLAAQRDMYLDANGEPRPQASLDGALSAAIPGQPAALVHIAHRYGKLPLARSLAPAIRYAKEGFTVTERYQRLLKLRLKVLDANAAAVFAPAGSVPKLGTKIRQPDLAATLGVLADRGRSGFYAGPVAEKLVRGVRHAGGIWSLEDLENYQVLERAPVVGHFHGVRIVSAALPSSGGVVLVAALNILEQRQADADAVTAAHWVIEAMRRAYHDRARYLGDPDFVAVDVAGLTSKGYGRLRAAGISAIATPSEALEFDDLDTDRSTGTDTTHLSILDDQGNRVAATLSINYPFGSGVMPAGTGVMLNNEMDDFVSKPGVGNVYGLTGSNANAIAPGKRPLSSMTPTFLEHPDRVVVLGTPGGSRIISMVLLTTLHLIKHGWDLEQAVNGPRFHHQFKPDVVSHEPGAFDDATAAALITKGHTLRRLNRRYGNMQAVLWDRRNNRQLASSDRRGNGAAQVRRVSAN